MTLSHHFSLGVIYNMGSRPSVCFDFWMGGLQLGDVLHGAHSWWTVLSMRRPKQESKDDYPGRVLPDVGGLTLPLFFWQVDFLGGVVKLGTLKNS